MFERNEVSKILIGIVAVNVAIFLLISPFIESFSDADLVNLIGVFAPLYFAQGLFWTSLTNTFVHFDLLHLLFNMIALFQIGTYVNNFYSTKKFFSVYILGGIVSSLAFFLAVLIGFFGSNAMQIPSIGASGAVYAVLGLLIGGTIKRNKYGQDLPFSLSSFIPTILLMIYISFLPNINWASHIGGLIFGIVMGLIFENDLNPYSRKNSEKIENLFFYSSLLILIIFIGSYLFNIFTIIFLS